MNNILEQITARKKEEVAERKDLYPVSLLERSAACKRPVSSLKSALRAPGSSGIIAEFKRRSPSKGWFSRDADPVVVVPGYVASGACALSVLTDSDFFGGTNEDLVLARAYTACPILRKDFVVDEYQVLEARAIGADAVLLIAAVLPPARIAALAEYAAALGLEVVLELHEERELEALCPGVDIVGINNRDLKTFRTDVSQSVNMLPLIPAEFVKISESGLQDAIVVATLKALGFEGFLIGEQFMQHQQPALACAGFIQQLKELEYAN